MPSPHLTLHDVPRLDHATLLLALAGWMDGGMVSTGTVRHMMSSRDAREIATVDADPFTIYQIPGPMEVAAMFRPVVKMKEGVVHEFEQPRNTFYADTGENLVFFLGREPNLQWQAFGQAMFELIERAGITRIIFIGSFGGTVPHTREPRMYGSVSHPRLRSGFTAHGIKLSDYAGPTGFATWMLAESLRRNVDMLSLVAEIPGYLQGVNPLSIEAVTRRLASILSMPLEIDKLREASNEWEVQVTEAVEKDADLAATVKKLEEKYDNELIGVVTEDDDDEEDLDDEDED